MVLFLKVLAFTIVMPGTVVAVLPYAILTPQGYFPWPEPGVLFFAGLLPLGSGLVFYARCAWDFAVAGRGTPAPIDPPKELVVRGLYRYSRNPMYVGVLQVLLGEVLIFHSMRLLVYAVVVASGFHLFVLLYGEPTLRRKFGPAYDDYCARVPRWLGRAKYKTRTTYTNHS
jgi:protein-S-isoprenylcysteine O-methyltransferase Ste14